MPKRRKTAPPLSPVTKHLRQMQRQLREAIGRERYWQRRWEALIHYVNNRK